jgi:hypothetical protein
VSSTRILFRRMRLDLLLQPGWYGVLTVQALVTLLLQYEFARSVGSVGMDPSRSPVYEVVYRLLTGVYGDAAVHQLLASGPGILALWCGMVAPVVYVVFSTILAMGGDRRSGMLELILFAPVDLWDYVVATVVRDSVALGAATLLGATVTVVGSVLFNFPVGSWLVGAVLVPVVVWLLLVLWGSLVGRLIASQPAAFAASIVLGGAFLMLHLARTASGIEIQSSIGRAVTTIAGLASPFLYGEVIYDGARTGDAGRVILGVFGVIAVGTVILVVHRIVDPSRGKRI